MAATARAIAASGFREGRRRERAARRERANLAARTVVDPARVVDPLLRRGASEGGAARLVVVGVAASFAIHVVASLAASAFAAVPPARLSSFTEPVRIVHDTPASPTPEPPPIVVPPPNEPPPPTLTKAAIHPKPVTDAPMETPADPIDVAPPVPAPPTPPRRIVGINMESTVTAGDGPVLAVGNTRMGETAAVTADPRSAPALGASFTPPRRSQAVPPVYPPALRAAAIEGDVGLRADIDAGGKVTAVTVVDPSGHPEFDRAAVEAAERTLYEPARVGSVAVAHAIDFTVRFRLTH